MRLLVVNPNTSAAMTASIGSAARAVAGAGTDIEAVNPAMGPVSIEGYYDEAFAVPGLLAEIAAGEARGADAAVIACFDDTGLDAARAMARIPVVGICEAGLAAAGMIAARISVVTTLPRSVVPIDWLVRRYGMAGRAFVHAADIPVLALEARDADVVAKLRDAVAAAIAADSADAVVLGCAGMASLAAELSADLGVPVVEGVSAAVRFAESLVALGLRTGKTGPYARPLQKAYSGAMAPFAPK
ncbi:MAG: aspartate/glutamate racemase family protein [Bauldia sp.]